MNAGMSESIITRGITSPKFRMRDVKNQILLFVFVFCMIPFQSSWKISKGTFPKRQYLNHFLPGNTSFYMNEFEEISLTECSLWCLVRHQKCAGVFYNDPQSMCKLLENKNTELVELYVNPSWGYWSGFSVCDPGWFPFQEHCYFKSKEKITWSEARDHCKKRGGYLVEIETMNENEWIRSRLTPAQCTVNWVDCVIWIGASDQQTDGQFIWDWSRAGLNFTNWRDGEPNNFGQREDCVVMEYPSGKWGDFPCSDQHSYICEKIYNKTPLV